MNRTGVERLPLMAARLPLLDPLVGTAHLVKNAEQGVENAEADDGRRPEADKNSDQLVVGCRAKDKDIDRQQNG